MTAYIIRRLLLLPITIFCVTLFVFGLYSLLDPGMKAALPRKKRPDGKTTHRGRQNPRGSRGFFHSP